MEMLDPGNTREAAAINTGMSFALTSNGKPSVLWLVSWE